ncbi:MAG: hypothetical protein ACRC5M_06765 [Anaeroplasmataceae bacterium]
MYSKKFDNFNDDIILNIRKNDDMVQYIDETWQEIQRHIPKNMKYLGYHFDDAGRRFRELNSGKDKSGSNRKTMSIYDTAARLCVFEFELTNMNQQTGQMETCYIECPIYIPIYVDNYHFYIRGNKYSIPYQVIDAITYTNRENMIVLKTKTRAIKMSREKKPNGATDAFGNKYVANVYYLFMTSKKVPFILYYFAYFGFYNTFRYFGAEKYCKFIEALPQVPDEKYVYFKFGLIYIMIEKEAFDKFYNLRNFIFTVLECQKRNLDQDSINDVMRWKTILGSSISENNALEKGKGLVRTFMISLDNRTVSNIAKLVGGSPKENMWSVARWMFLKFSTLSSKSNNLLNKRIRISEWIIDPFLKETYKKLYRYLSTNEKSRDINRLIDITKCPESLILGAICGKNRASLTLNIAKYSDGVNDNVLVKDALRYTTNGPGTPGSSGGALTSTQFRIFDPSYVGRIDIYQSSNSSPGTGGHILPTAKIRMDTLTFDKEI